MSSATCEARLVFPPSVLHAFLTRVLERVTRQAACAACGCSERTLRDWRREKYLIPKSSLYVLSELSGVPVPAPIEARPAYWHAKAAAEAGATATQQKYGRLACNDARRKERWREWWEKRGTFTTGSITSPKALFGPSQVSNWPSFAVFCLAMVVSHRTK